MKLPSVKITRVYKLWALAFAQIWLWPQVMSNDLSPSVGVSMTVTIMICLIFNLIGLVHAYERKDDE
jgi:hypothetical protein